MKNILNIKFRREVSFRNSMYIIFAVIVYLFIFFIAFKPFYLTHYTGSELLQLTLLYCAAALIPSCLFFCSQRFLDVPFFDEDNWTVGKEIITADLIILPIAFLFLLIDVYFNEAPFSIWGYLTELKHVGLLSIFPVMVVIMAKVNLALRKKVETQKETQKFIQQEIHKIGPAAAADFEEPILICVNSENKSDCFQLLVSQFYYAESDGNYIDLYFKKNNINQKKTIRGSIKNLLTDFKGQSNIVKSHRSYIVNVNKITSFQGNSRGYKIKFSDDFESVPVSRNQISTIKTLLSSQ